MITNRYYYYISYYSSIINDFSKKYIFVFKENLALRRPAWELHPWPYTDRDYGSQNAVDGLYSNRTADGGQCSISANNNCTEALWRVDLGEIVSISHINIFFMTDNEQGIAIFLVKKINIPQKGRMLTLLYQK